MALQTAASIWERHRSTPSWRLPQCNIPHAMQANLDLPVTALPLQQAPCATCARCLDVDCRSAVKRGATVTVLHSILLGHVPA